MQRKRARKEVGGGEKREVGGERENERERRVYAGE
jgi:hypothetical protein